MHIRSRSPKWTFDFEPSYPWLDDFLHHYIWSGLDFEIFEDREDHSVAYGWKSSHLETLSDIEEIRTRAAALKALFDGAMLVKYPDRYRQSLAVGPLEDSRLKSCELQFPFEPFGTEWKDWRYAKPANPLGTDVGAWLFLSRYDEVAKQMLIFLGGTGVNWISLYAMKDFMNEAGWEADRLAQAAGASKARIKEFAATANNVRVLGPFARHGEISHPRRPNPMTLKDAKTLILTCVQRFLSERVNSENIADKFRSICVDG